MIIRKVNALAGAGKTFAAVHYADRNARIGHKYALVQPTQDLIDETVKEIRKLKSGLPGHGDPWRHVGHRDPRHRRSHPHGPLS